MIRADMISTVGRAYLASNIENDEYISHKLSDFYCFRLAFSKVFRVSPLSLDKPVCFLYNTTNLEFVSILVDF